MKSLFAFLLVFVSVSSFANCEQAEFDRVRLAAKSSQVCLAKYLGSALSRGMGQWSEESVTFFQERLLREISLISEEENFLSLPVYNKIALGKAACAELTNKDFPKYLCQDAAGSMSRPNVVAEIYCNKIQNIQDGLCR